MPFGTRLYNSASQLSFDSDRKTYVYQEKIYPNYVDVLAGKASSAEYCTKSGLQGPVFPFVATPDNTPATISVSKYNASGITMCSAYPAQNSTDLYYTPDVSYTTDWPRIYVGCHIKNSSGQTAQVTAIADAPLGQLKATLSVAIPFASQERIYCVEFVDTYYIHVGLHSNTTSAGSFPMRVFSRNVPTSNTGHGMLMYDSAGTCTFNSNYPILTLAASASMPSGTGTGTPSTLTVSSGSIPSNYSVFAPNLGTIGENYTNTWFTNYGSISGLGPTRVNATTIQPSYSRLLSAQGYLYSGVGWDLAGSANIMFIDNANYP